MDFVWSVVGFILMMGLIVTIHEYGHFQVARWFNIKVTDFSVGFGKALYQKQIGEVAFKVGAVPLGGYVKFVDEREGTVAETDLDRAFNRQSVYKRFAVVAAGPAINLLLAWMIFMAIQLIGTNTLKPLVSEQSLQAMIGQSYSSNESHSTTSSDFSQNSPLWELTQIDQQPIASWQSAHQQILLALIAEKPKVELNFAKLNQPEITRPVTISLAALDINNTDPNWLGTLGLKPAALQIDAVVGQVIAQGPADLAGLQEDDRVLAFNGKTINSWQQLVSLIQSNPNQLVSLKVQRGEVELIQSIKLDSVENPETGVLQGRIGLGVKVDESQMQPFMNRVQLGVVEAAIHGYQKSIDLIVMSYQMLTRMVMGEVSLSHLSGPLSIAQFSGQAVQSGLISFLSLLGLLSLSIGFLNLLPIPVLDGGHLLYYTVEMIKGSPVSEQAMIVGQNVGLFFIISLTLLALFNDVIRLSNG